jgi:hypothetical protein
MKTLYLIMTCIYILTNLAVIFCMWQVIKGLRK